MADDKSILGLLGEKALHGASGVLTAADYPSGVGRNIVGSAYEAAIENPIQGYNTKKRIDPNYKPFGEINYSDPQVKQNIMDLMQSPDARLEEFYDDTGSREIMTDLDEYKKIYETYQTKLKEGKIKQSQQYEALPEKIKGLEEEFNTQSKKEISAYIEKKAYEDDVFSNRSPVGLNQESFRRVTDKWAPYVGKTAAATLGLGADLATDLALTRLPIGTTARTLKEAYGRVGGELGELSRKGQAIDKESIAKRELKAGEAQSDAIVKELTPTASKEITKNTPPAEVARINAARSRVGKEEIRKMGLAMDHKRKVDEARRLGKTSAEDVTLSRPATQIKTVDNMLPVELKPYAQLQTANRIRRTDSSASFLNNLPDKRLVDEHRAFDISYERDLQSTFELFQLDGPKHIDIMNNINKKLEPAQDAIKEQVARGLNYKIIDERDLYSAAEEAVKTIRARGNMKKGTQPYNEVGRTYEQFFEYIKKGPKMKEITDINNLPKYNSDAYDKLLKSAEDFFQSKSVDATKGAASIHDQFALTLKQNLRAKAWLKSVNSKNKEAYEWLAEYQLRKSDLANMKVLEAATHGGKAYTDLMQRTTGEIAAASVSGPAASRAFANTAAALLNPETAKYFKNTPYAETGGYSRRMFWRHVSGARGGVKKGAEVTKNVVTNWKTPVTLRGGATVSELMVPEEAQAAPVVNPYSVPSEEDLRATDRINPYRPIPGI